MKLTITEALSEVNLIKKKIEAKQTFIKSNMFSYNHLKDPYASEGGIAKKITSELQSLKDLQTRLEKIRAKISEANLHETLTVGETTKTVMEWLAWKREISASQTQFVNFMLSSIKSELDRYGKTPQVFKDDAGNNHLAEITPNIDIPAWQREQENLMTINEVLDGKLSLKNATMMIDI